MDSALRGLGSETRSRTLIPEGRSPPVRAPTAILKVMTLVTSIDQSPPSSGDVRWRTAFWAAIVATPLFAFGLAALLPAHEHNRNIIETSVLWSLGALILTTLLTWRWPRVSGIALGIAAPFIAVGLLIIIGLVSEVEIP